MSITVVQSNTGNFPQGAGNTAQTTLFNVGAGNAILVCTMVLSINPINTNFSAIVTEGVSPSLITYQDITGNTINYDYLSGPIQTVGDIAILTGAASGTHTINVAVPTGTNSNGYIVAIEISGLLSSAVVDTQANAITSGACGPTANPFETNEIAFGMIVVESTTNGTLSSPSGYTNIFNHGSGTPGAIRCSVDYLTPITSSGQSIAYPNYGSGTQAISFLVLLKGLSSITATPTLDMNINSGFINVSFAANASQGNVSIPLQAQEINIANLSNYTENFNVSLNGVFTANINVAQTQFSVTETGNTYMFTITSVNNAFAARNIQVPVLNYAIANA